MKQFFGSAEDTSAETNGEAGNGHHTGVASQLANRMNGMTVANGSGWGEDNLSGHNNDQWTKSFDRNIMTQQSLDDKALMLENQLPMSFETRSNNLMSQNQNWTGSGNEGDVTAGDFILFGDRELTIDCVNLLRNGFLYTGDICKEIVFPALSSCNNDLNTARQSAETPEEPSSAQVSTVGFPFLNIQLI